MSFSTIKLDHLRTKKTIQRERLHQEKSVPAPHHKLYEIWDVLRKATVTLPRLNPGLKLGETPGWELTTEVHSAGLAQGTRRARLVNIRKINEGTKE